MNRSKDNNDVAKPSEEGGVLERNVAELMARAHDAPRMSDQARARILAHLESKVTTARETSVRPARDRRVAWGVGLALAAGVAILGIASQVPGERDASRITAQSPKRVMLPDGSELLLNRDAEVVRTGRRQLKLVRGEVVLDVAKDGTPFVVDAPHGRVVVLGTRFALGAADGKTWAAVMRGRVRIQNAAGATELRAGERGELARGVRPERRPAPRLSHLASWAKLARRQQEKAGPKPARRGALVARNPQWQQQEFPLPMRELTVDVHVENQIARVAMDQTFFNPQPQQLEGVYQFTLPPGASISRQAMYVNGKLMESAVVERVHGRRIYEDIVYRRRDPALMEWMAGNQFKVRIFPLVGRREKRILMAYTQSLERLYDDYKLEIPMPEVDAPVRRMSFRARLVGCADCTIRSSSHDIDVTRDGRDAVVRFERKGDSLTDDVLLSVRNPRRGAGLVSYTQGKDTYWMARVRPDIAVETAAHKARRWVLLHDTSASRSTLERKAQAFVIDHLLRELDEDDEVSILAFDTSVRRFGDGFVRVGDVDRVAVARFLTAEGADGVGHTDLHKVLGKAAAMLSAAPSGKESMILYLGDGIATADERRLSVLRKSVAGRARFVGVAVGPRMDARFMRSMAAATGGMFAAMNPGEDLAWRTFDLVAALNTPRVVGLDASFVDANGDAIGKDTAYASSRQLADGEELTLVARTRSERRPAMLRLRGSVDGQPWTRDLIIAPEHRAAAYLPRIWAQRRIDHLIEVGATEHKKEITKLGMANYLMTPFTSLLVLETDAMYKKYAVHRDKAARWAAYPAPAKIKVVHEPLKRSGDAVTLGHTLARRPVQLFYRYGGVQRGVFDSLTTVGVGDIEELNGGFGTGVGGGGTRRASLRTVTAEAGADGQEAAQMPVTVTSSPVGGTVALDGDRTSADSNKQQIRDMTTWSVSRGPRPVREQPAMHSNEATVLLAKNAEGRRGGEGWFDFHSADNGLIAGQGQGRFSGRGKIAGGLYYQTYVRPPTPMALHYSRDARLDDLTEFLPGLFPQAVDLPSAASAKGRVSAAARQRLRWARLAVPTGRYKGDDGAIIDVDGLGRFRIDHRLPSGLREHVVFDGTHLYHVYPALAVATKRDARDVAPAVLGRWMPFVLPTAEQLEAGYRVDVNGDKIVLTSAAAHAKVRAAVGPTRVPSVEISLDSKGRVVDIAHKRGASVRARLRLTHSGSSIVLSRRGVSRRLDRTGSIHPIAAPSADTYAVVHMALRPVAYWKDRMSAAKVGSSQWRHAAVQLIASYAAVHNEGGMRDTVASLAKASAVTRGVLALASRGLARAADAELSRALHGRNAGDPVIRYLRAATALSRRGDRTAFDDFGAPGERSLVDMLGRYRQFLLAGEQASTRGKALRGLDEIAQRYPASPMLYVGATQFANRWAWSAHKDAVRAWDLVGEGGALSPMAEFQAVRVLYNKRKLTQATARLDKVMAKGGHDFPVDATIRNLFRQSPRGDAGWRLFWSQWRAANLKRGDTDSLLRLMRAAVGTGETADVDRIAARAAQVGIADEGALLAFVDLLRSARRFEQAMNLVKARLAANPDSAALLSRAAAIANAQGRPLVAIGHLERLMRAGEGQPIPLRVLRADYQQLVSLLGRAAQATSGADRDDLVRRARKAVAEWRRLDPANMNLDRAAARMLFSVNRPGDARRYLMTAIERRPGEGTAYDMVATALQGEGDIAEAVALWKRAADVDPTNPTWHLRRVRGLVTLGKSGEAKKLLRDITDKKWHNRFSNTVYQAKRLRQTMGF